MAWSVKGSVCTTVTVNTVWLRLETFRFQNVLKQRYNRANEMRQDEVTISHGDARPSRPDATALNFSAWEKVVNSFGGGEPLFATERHCFVRRCGLTCLELIVVCLLWGFILQ